PEHRGGEESLSNSVSTRFFVASLLRMTFIEITWSEYSIYCGVHERKQEKTNATSELGWQPRARLDRLASSVWFPIPAGTTGRPGCGLGQRVHRCGGGCDRDRHGAPHSADSRRADHRGLYHHPGDPDPAL